MSDMCFFCKREPADSTCSICKRKVCIQCSESHNCYPREGYGSDVFFKVVFLAIQVTLAPTLWTLYKMITEPAET